MVEAVISLIRLSEYWASLFPKLDEFRNGVDETNPEMQHLARYLKLNETPLQNGETLPTRARRNLEAQVGIDKKTMDKYIKNAQVPKSIVEVFGIGGLMLLPTLETAYVLQIPSDI